MLGSAPFLMLEEVLVEMSQFDEKDESVGMIILIGAKMKDEVEEVFDVRCGLLHFFLWMDTWKVDSCTQALCKKVCYA